MARLDCFETATSRHYEISEIHGGIKTLLRKKANFSGSGSARPECAGMVPKKS
jgi:hypothetical protein